MRRRDFLQTAGAVLVASAGVRAQRPADYDAFEKSILQLQSDMTAISPAYRVGWVINALTFTVLVVYLIVARYHVFLLQRMSERHAEEQAMTMGSVHV